MTTSEPGRLPGDRTAADESPAARAAGGGLAGVYRLQSARRLLKALSGKALLQKRRSEERTPDEETAPEPEPPRDSG